MLKLKVGDRVICELNGRGVVVGVDEEIFPISVYFENTKNTVRYSWEGDYHIATKVLKKDTSLALVLEISTAHVKEPDANFDQFPVIARSDASIYLSVPTDPDDMAEMLADEKVPLSILITLVYAHRLGVPLLCLDRDADIVSELPLYDW